MICFINETARAHNTRVEASPESLMRIAMPKYKRIWCEEKISYAATSRLFHGTARYLMGFETCSRFLFYTAIIATITISILLHQWTIAAIAVLLMVSTLHDATDLFSEKPPKFLANGSSVHYSPYSIFCNLHGMGYSNYNVNSDGKMSL